MYKYGWVEDFNASGDKRRESTSFLKIEHYVERSANKEGNSASRCSNYLFKSLRHGTSYSISC